ncbi:MAG: hypothetical protein O3C07_01475 [Bacteroidetes bacterium]|nr:hypothetical protein [Bacteroidota bacterium]
MLRLLILVMVLAVSIQLSAQLPKGPSRNDFELKGPVKICAENSIYGQEVFEFDREGRLIFLKSTYESSEHQEVRFTYNQDTLTHKSINVYRNGILVKDESFLFQYAYMQGSYSELIVRLDEGSVTFSKNLMDTSGRVIYTEIQEDKNRDRIDYQYVSSSDSIQTKLFKNDQLISTETEYFNNATQLLKSVVVHFSDEKPVEKTQLVYNTQNKVVELLQWQYSDSLVTLSNPTIRHINTYDEQGYLEIKRIEINNSAKRTEYLYQYDQHSPKNWVKKIERPSNHYTNRMLTYFEI